MTTKQKQYKASLIRKYHTICGKLGMTDSDKRNMLESNYGVRSSTNLYIDELQQLCKNLESPSASADTKSANELDKARKRVIAALFAYLRFIGYSPNMDYVKEVACKASKTKHFNRISLEKLKRLYRIFGEMHKKKSDEWSDEILNKIAEGAENE